MPLVWGPGRGALSRLGHCHLGARVSDTPGIWVVMAQFVETSGFRPHGDLEMTNIDKTSEDRKSCLHTL